MGVDDGPAAEEQLDGRLGAGLGGAVERGDAVHVPGVHVGPLAQEQRREDGAGQDGGEVEGALPQRVTGVRVGTLVDEQPHHVSVAAQRTQVDGVLAVVVGRVHVDVVRLQQRLDDVQRAAEYCEVQQRDAELLLDEARLPQTAVTQRPLPERPPPASQRVHPALQGRVRLPMRPAVRQRPAVERPEALCPATAAVVVIVDGEHVEGVPPPAAGRCRAGLLRLHQTQYVVAAPARRLSRQGDTQRGVVHRPPRLRPPTQLRRHVGAAVAVLSRRRAHQDVHDVVLLGAVHQVLGETHVQRRLSRRVPRAHVGASSHQQPHQVSLVGFRRQVQRRLAVRVARVDVDSFRQQELHDLAVTLASRHV